MSRWETQMTLNDVVLDLDALDDESILCVRKPWAPTAECVASSPAENLGVPTPVKDAGYSYFMEVFVAREVLGVFGATTPTQDEKVRALIYYAENDAYPDWVFQR